MNFRILALFLALMPALAVAAPNALRAQNILVTTGEHADFTRMVLQSAHPIDWSLAQSGRARVLRIEPVDARIDLSRAFQRIPRTRLSRIERNTEGLVLHLDCDCPIRAWAENPRLIVLDIDDAPDVPPAAAPSARTAFRFGAPAYPVSAPRSDLARSAGIALAQDWSQTTDPMATGVRPAGSARFGPMPNPIAEGDRESILHHLATQITGALGQGILVPAAEHASGAAMLLPDDSGMARDIPPNMRVTSVLDRPGDEPVQLADETASACGSTLALSFTIAAAPDNFNMAKAALMQRWIGEFDQPDHTATGELIALYLQHGFGAEARALVENAVLPIHGRDLLLGFGDMLEGRQSNSRLRLAEQIDCGGVASMLAILAGTPSRLVDDRAREIAGTFAQAPNVLRAVIGADLVRALIDSNAVDAGRIVADTLRRTNGVTDADMAIIDALLDRARGNQAQAAAHLDRLPGDDTEMLLLRMVMALETGETLPEADLLNAEAVAGSLRTQPIATDLMAAAIRLRVAAGEPLKGLALLDRLAQWQNGNASDEALRGFLADFVWHGLARQAPDQVFLDLILTRSDWNNTGFEARTREALAERMLAFGLVEAAQPLLQSVETEALRHLRAQSHLSAHRPHEALTLLATDTSERAQELRARALQAQGEGQEAGMILTRMGAFDTAAHHAVLTRDWALLAEIGASTGSAQQHELVRALSTQPGGVPAAPAAEVPEMAISAAEVEGTLPANAVTSIAAQSATRTVTPAAAPNAAPNATSTAAATEAATGAATRTAPDSSSVPPLAERGMTPRPESTVQSGPDPLIPDAMQRGAMLLAESTRLRETLGQLIEQGAQTERP